MAAASQGALLSVPKHTAHPCCCKVRWQPLLCSEQRLLWWDRRRGWEQAGSGACTPELPGSALLSLLHDTRTETSRRGGGLAEGRISCRGHVETKASAEVKLVAVVFKGTWGLGTPILHKFPRSGHVTPLMAWFDNLSITASRKKKAAQPCRAARRYSEHQT